MNKSPYELLINQKLLLILITRIENSLLWRKWLFIKRIDIIKFSKLCNIIEMVDQYRFFICWLLNIITFLIFLFSLSCLLICFLIVIILLVIIVRVVSFLYVIRIGIRIVVVWFTCFVLWRSEIEKIRKVHKF